MEATAKANTFVNRLLDVEPQYRTESELKTTGERRKELRAWATRNQYYPVVMLIDDIDMLLGKLEEVQGSDRDH